MKKFVVLIMLLLPLGLAAQEVKIATVDVEAVFMLMPELSSVENELVTMSNQYEKEVKQMEEEYTRKMTDLTAQSDSLTDNIRQLRIQEIQSIQARMENFVQLARETQSKKQEELMEPIRAKLQKAIKDVGDENGYTYILHPQMVLYKSTSAIDATDKVKAKLGLK